MDRISDMFTFIIFDDLLQFSNNKYKEMKVAGLEEYTYNSKKYNLVMRSEKTPFILLPKDILSEIPVATSRAEIDDIVQKNNLIKRMVDKEYVDSYKSYKDTKKRKLLNIFLKDTTILKHIIDELKSKDIDSYDFDSDELGIIEVYKKSFEEASKLDYRKLESKSNLFEFVKKLIELFKFLIEKKDLKTELYDSSGKTRSEVTSHKLFYPIAYTAKTLKLFDFSFEPNVGKGPVEYKFNDLKDTVLVEFKLSKHTRIVDGYNKQLQDYMEREKTKYGVYVIMEVEDGKPLTKFYESVNPISFEKPVFVIDGKKEKSSSKL